MPVPLKFIGILRNEQVSHSYQADVVYLSPPWGGMEYLEEEVYNVYRLGGTMNCVRLMRAAQSITPNVALYLPRNSDVCQVMEAAGGVLGSRRAFHFFFFY